MAIDYTLPAVQTTQDAQVPSGVVQTPTIPAPVYSTPTAQDFGAQYDAVAPTITPESQAVANENAQLKSLLGIQTQAGQEQAQQFASLGGNDATAKLASITGQYKAADLQNQQQQQAYLQQTRNIGGYTQNAQTGGMEDINRANAVKKLGLAADAAILTGNIEQAKTLSEQAIKAKYGDIQAQIDQHRALYDLNKDMLTRADKAAADKKNYILDQQQKALDKKIADEKDISNLAIKIGANGAPAGAVKAIKNAKTFNDAIVAAAPYLQSASDKADLSYKIAQTAKIYNDIKESARTNGSNMDPSQSLAYAQEYAATGKIPTGIPKGGFGTVSQWAKELPKQNGEIISTATGVHPAQDSTYADALSSLSSVVKLAQDLKEQDKNRIGGIVGGTLGAITGSEAQGNYLSTRSQIVDLLSRARSGAALTENEVKTYESMIPGRFSEPLGIGQNSDVKIQQFVDAITKDMQNKAAAKGWSIYGVSKVKLGDNEFKVGDLIQANGKTGRVNADGSITLVQ